MIRVPALDSEKFPAPVTAKLIPQSRLPATVQLLLAETGRLLTRSKLAPEFMDQLIYVLVNVTP
jgi:hypothetical protein